MMGREQEYPRPSRQRLYRMLYLDGLSSSTVAHQLGVPAQVVRRWMMEEQLGSHQVAQRLARITLDELGVDDLRHLLFAKI